MKVSPGDVIIVDFPGVTGTKRRPVVVLSSDLYHSSRPDVIVGLLTSQTAAALAPTDYSLQDWKSAGLRVASTFRCFLATLPLMVEPVIAGRLSERDWESVKERVKRSVALEPSVRSGVER